MVPQGVGNNPNMQQPGPSAMQGMQNRGPMMGGMNPQGMMNQMGGGQGVPGVQGQMMGGGVPQQQQQQQGMNQMQGLPQQQMMGNQQQQMQMNMGMNQMGVGGPGGGQGMVNMVPGGQMGMSPMGGGNGAVNNVPVVNQGMPMNQGMVVSGGPVSGGGGGVPTGAGMNVNQMQNSPAGGNQMNMMNQMGMGRKPQDMMMNSPGMFSPTVRSVTPNQYMRENPSPSVPSPANMGNPQNQMIPSPAMAQTPSPQMMNVNQRNMANVMAPSPGTSLNTPGQPGTIPSPMNPQEEALYKEKYRQLVKYIEPLTRMTAKMAQEKNSEWTLSGFISY